MKIATRTAAALTITASSLVLAVGAGASDAVVPADGDFEAGVIYCCTYGEEGPSTFVALPTWSSTSALNYDFDYGSAELIQLGYGPGGPSRAPLPEQATAPDPVDDSWVAGAV